MQSTDPWLAVDRAYELAGEVADDQAEKRAAATVLEAGIVRHLATAGDEATLATLAESMADRLSADGITEQLIRTALSCGPLLAGVMLLDLVGKCIFDGAAAAAEIECGGVPA